jgi:hypothetical protein
MPTPIDLSLRRIGERLQKDGEDTVQTPMPWTFLDLLCQLDEREETLADQTDAPLPAHRGSEGATGTKSEDVC